MVNVGRPYFDPWIEPLFSRIQALKAGTQRIAFIYDVVDNSTFRYRVYNMREALTQFKDVSSTYFLSHEIASLDESLFKDVTFVVCRYRISPVILAFIHLQKRLGNRVLFDVDDLVFDTKYAPLLMNTLGSEDSQENLQYWYGYISRIGETLKLCDGVITTNTYLSKKAQEFSDLPTYVIPNFMNELQLKKSLAVRTQNDNPSDVIKVGYFSGTPTHNNDFLVTEDALIELMYEQPEIELQITGFLHVERINKAHPGRVKFAPLTDFVDLQSRIAECRLNLVPLQLNAFTNCKSELKFFESAAVDVTTIASPAFTYKSCMQHGFNGFIASGHQWYNCMKLALRDDGSISRNARNLALKRYTPLAVKDNLANTYYL